MKKIIFLISFIFVMCGNISAQTYGTGKIAADPTTLHGMTKAKRDSTLLAVSKEALLKYGPGYYKDTHKTVIEDLGVDFNHIGYEGLRLYKVTYIYDKRFEQLEMDYAAEVYVRSDNSKVIKIRYGNGWGEGWLDKLTDAERSSIYMPYQQKVTTSNSIIYPARIWNLDSKGDTLWYRKSDAGTLIRIDSEGNDLFPSFDAGNNAGRFTGTNP